MTVETHRKRLSALLRAVRAPRVTTVPEDLEPGENVAVTIGGQRITARVLAYDVETVTLEARTEWGVGILTRPWEVVYDWQRVS